MNIAIPEQLKSPIERVLWACLWPKGPRGRRGLPFVLVGDPGTAKTSKIELIARLAGLPCESVIASLRQPHDFLGLPVLSKAHDQAPGELENYVTRYATPSFATTATERKWCVVLLDEISTCPPSVQAALLRPIFEGVCGEQVLPQGVRFLLAMNEVDDAAGGWDISLPLANRVGWLKWDAPDLQEFIGYLMAGGGAALEAAPVVEAADMEEQFDLAWDAAWAEAVGSVASFLKSKPDLQHKKPRDMSQGRAWPSCRTWDLATTALAACIVFRLSQIDRALAVGAFVGTAAATELSAFLQMGDLPDLTQLLDGKVGFKHDDARPDKTVSVLVGATSLVCMARAFGKESKEERQKRWATALWGVIHALPEGALDTAIPTALALMRQKLVQGIPIAFKAMARLEPILRAVSVYAPNVNADDGGAAAAGAA